MVLDNEIIVSRDNTNLDEIMDYLHEFYIEYEDYRLEFTHNAVLGVPRELLSVKVVVLTDELNEDGNLEYLIAEGIA